jgi:hypothetical protein
MGQYRSTQGELPTCKMVWFTSLAPHVNDKHGWWGITNWWCSKVCPRAILLHRLARWTAQEEPVNLKLHSRHVKIYGAWARLAIWDRNRSCILAYTSSAQILHPYWYSKYTFCLGAPRPQTIRGCVFTDPVQGTVLGFWIRPTFFQDTWSRLSWPRPIPRFEHQYWNPLGRPGAYAISYPRAYPMGPNLKF